MPLQFAHDFWNANGRNLTKPTLDCLKQDADTYNTLLFQPKEYIDYNNDGIWISDKEKAFSKFTGFIDLAIQQNVALAVTPEYSCPWDVIHNLIHENKLPGENNLWILGTASIHPQELRNFINAHDQVTWILDEELLNQHLNNPHRFFDPVCIILTTRDNNNNPVNVIIVQFKTYFFGGEGFEWERDHMIKGSTVFVISNLFASTKLVVLICSDSLRADLNFNTINNGSFLNDPLLIIHIQLNQAPLQLNYKTYRNFIFGSGDKNLRKEVICLNWARGVSTGENHCWNHYGASAFYIKSEKINLKDERINQNHSRGLYYSNWHDRRSHILFLNYDEYIFLVNNTKPSQETADPAQFARSGPEMTRLYSWDGTWKVTPQSSNDFSNLCTNLEEEIGDISCIKDSEFINVERLVELSLGKLQLTADWFKPHRLSTFFIKDDEISLRLNFAQDPTPAIKDIREDKITKYAYIKHVIIIKAENLPGVPFPVELKYDLSVDHPEKYLLNLHSTVSNQKATGIFIDVSNPSKAKATRQAIESLFTGSQQRRKVIVWYYFKDDLKKEIDEVKKPSITDNLDRPSPSYKKTTE